jgi:hypothetical protein
MLRINTQASSQAVMRNNRRGVEEADMVHESAVRPGKCDLVAVGLHIIVYHPAPISGLR